MKWNVEGLCAERCYHGADETIAWSGFIVTDQGEFAEFLSGPVKDRLRDRERDDEFAAELQALATTGMASEFLEKLLNAVPASDTADIGEALAECVLESDRDREITWPWNTSRDRRTPRASLPGADLVGFCRHDGVVLLLFGEVKTSADKRVPPRVMSNRDGMPWQLGQNATELGIQHSLLKWLRSRCLTAELKGLYRAAVSRYVSSGGKEMLLVGVLLRDTTPAEGDVNRRVQELANRIGRPTQAELTVLYLPASICDWKDICQGRAT
jgi:hypothetical protein